MQSGLSIKARAVALLSRREHSRLELARKLAPHSDDPDALACLLDDLTREGWLSDERFAQSIVHRRGHTHGTARIVNELRQSGVPEQAIADARDALRDTEFERARAVYEKKFGARRHADAFGEGADHAPFFEDAPADGASTPDVAQARRLASREAHAKQARFLAGRGFSQGVIARVLGGDRSDDE